MRRECDPLASHKLEATKKTAATDIAANQFVELCRNYSVMEVVRSGANTGQLAIVSFLLTFIIITLRGIMLISALLKYS